MDENKHVFKLTTAFNDGQMVTEFFRSQRAANRAKQWWVRVQKIDAEHGIELYEISSFRIEAL